MSLSIAVLDALMKTGATREQLYAAMQADIAEREAAVESKLEAKRAGNRERQQRKRTKSNGKSRNVTPVTRDDRDKGSNERDNLTSKTEVTEANASSPRPWSLPSSISLQTWTDFLTNRKRKRLGNTPSTWKTFNDDLARVSAQTGIPPPKLIELCTGKGWGAIYDPRDNRHGQSSSNIASLRGARPDPALDLLRAARAAENREADRGAGAALPAIGSG